MKAHLFVATICAAALAAGCEAEHLGTTMSLGDVSYDRAFDAARDAMSEHFSIASADKDAGLIEAEARGVEAKPEGIFRDSPARQIATMRLRREAREVTANLAVELQRQESAVHYQIQMAASDYETVPRRTPSQTDGATTVEQNEAWQTESYDPKTEAKVLRRVYASLHGGE